MPLLGYQNRFVEDIVSGSKPHTIRAKRKHPIKAGDRLFMYTNLRQKTCKKIGEAVCSKVERIRIYSGLMTHRDGGQAVFRVYIGPKKLTYEEMNSLALADGFESLWDFLNFFRDTHGKRFEGQLIHWKEFKRTKWAIGSSAISNLKA